MKSELTFLSTVASLRDRGIRESETDTSTSVATTTVAIVGLGYVGLPSALHLLESNARVIGFDVSDQRISDIRNHTVELIPEDFDRLTKYLPSDGSESNFELTTESARLSEAKSVLICVPTPLNPDLSPNLSHLQEACSRVVAEARSGQTIILVSTTYVGCTNDLLVEPLTAAGFTVGNDIFVAFSPERINPGDISNQQLDTPRVLGAATSACLKNAEEVIQMCSSSVHLMSSLEAAEMTKLLENTYRAVNVAWINEMAAVAGFNGLDVNELINGAATKPFGYTKFTPGPGVGGHCIPCDPHYLMSGVPEQLIPLTSVTMQTVDARPKKASLRAIGMLPSPRVGFGVANVIIVGVSYKPDVQDVRESPALEILRNLDDFGLNVGYYDPLVKSVNVAGKTLSSVSQINIASADLVIWHTPHSILNPRALLAGAKLVLDLTYRLDTQDPRIHRLEVPPLTNNYKKRILFGA